MTARLGGADLRGAIISKTCPMSPDFGPDSGEHAIKNVYYSHDGNFRADLKPGSCDVIISHGPGYDPVFRRVDASRGKQAHLEAKLVHSVKTKGWISADFHSHSSPSGCGPRRRTRALDHVKRALPRGQTQRELGRPDRSDL